MAGQTSYYQGDSQFQLQPEDYTFFQVGRRRVKDAYDMAVDQNNMQRGLATNAYTRSVGDWTTKFDRMRQNLPGQYANAGLLNSGLYARGLQNFNSDKIRQMGNLSGAYQDQLTAFRKADEQLGLTNDGSIADLNTQEAARRAAAAGILGAK